MTLDIIAIVVSGGALLVSWRLGVRSANAAEGSEVEAGRSAEAAKASAKSAAEVAHAEKSRDHEMYRPADSAVAFTIDRDPRINPDRELLRLHLTPARNYRCSITYFTGPGGDEIGTSASLTLTEGLAERVVVEEIERGSVRPKVGLLRLAFWPPVKGDQGEWWTCQCGVNIDPNGEPHWVWNVLVPGDVLKEPSNW